MNKQIKYLLSLSDLDEQLLVYIRQKEAIEGRQNSLLSELNEKKKELQKLEKTHEEISLKQTLAAHRLRDEESKIVERRKKLTTIGGMKAAKLVEREIDIASKTISMMEATAMEALEEVDNISIELENMKEAIAAIESQYEEGKSVADEELVTIEKEIKSFTRKRATAVSKLEERLVKIYDRIKGRYPGDAVAKATKGSCRSCFRALPAQTYNQILSGNLFIQCPGCSRILVYEAMEKAA